MPKRNSITGAGVSYSKNFHGGHLVTVTVSRNDPRGGDVTRVYSGVRFMYLRKEREKFYLRGMMLMNAVAN